MSFTSCEFPLAWKQTPLGLVCSPEITVVVRTPGGTITRDFLIDTGAEVSVAPRGFAEDIGLIWDALPPIGASGLGPGQLDSRVAALAVRIGSVDLTLRCLFTDTPLFLLGRLDFLDRFQLTIDTRAQRITLVDYS
jgi:hypothetical protein